MKYKLVTVDLSEQAHENKVIRFENLLNRIGMTYAATAERLALRAMYYDFVPNLLDVTCVPLGVVAYAGEDVEGIYVNITDKADEEIADVFIPDSMADAEAKQLVDNIVRRVQTTEDLDSLLSRNPGEAAEEDTQPGVPVRLDEIYQAVNLGDDEDDGAIYTFPPKASELQAQSDFSDLPF